MTWQILRSLVRWVSRILRALLGVRFSLALWDQVIAGVQDATQVYVTYHLRPKKTVLIHTCSDVVHHLPPLAIVIQGPVITTNAFTLETVKLYKQHFPDASLILSTWNDQSPSVLQQFETLGITVLLNAKPDYAGVSNINLQIVSSKAGVEKAREIGVEYALKTRTDQRIYASNIAEYLYHVTQVFPVHGSWSKQRKRIVGCSLNTFKYRMYGLSDMLIYGHIEDMLLYWNVDLDQRVFSPLKLHEATTLRKFALWRICEVYLATEFIMKLGRQLEWSLKDSWQVFADHFCVVDKGMLDLYWGKYTKMEYRWLDYTKSLNLFDEINFREWLNLYAGLANRDIQEAILDQPLSD